MADTYELGNLAKTFARAVDTFNVREARTASFFNAATETELFTMLGIGAQLDTNPGLVTQWLDLAEIYAGIADRAGRSDDFKQFVPAKARTEEVRTALAKTYPKFAQLCV